MTRKLKPARVHLVYFTTESWHGDLLVAWYGLSGENHPDEEPGIGDFHRWNLTGCVEVSNLKHARHCGSQAGRPRKRGGWHCRINGALKC